MGDNGDGDDYFWSDIFSGVAALALMGLLVWELVSWLP